MTQKVLKVGSSAAVTIPKKSLEELGLKIGDHVSVQIDRKNQVVLIEPSNKKIDKKLLDWTGKFIEQYRPALEALAKK
ncbi:MAG: AbrB/MazE/SpoVT family DNA-binding domain-containing protein [Candidatus Doudnabacteria bacterium]|nr:AbrB/MazE/SpoVT family DNA-binding domain-containing protein [Candidatus Doudnabacteria bacterium]